MGNARIKTESANDKWIPLHWVWGWKEHEFGFSLSRGYLTKIRIRMGDVTCEWANVRFLTVSYVLNLHFPLDFGHCPPKMPRSTEVRGPSERELDMICGQLGNIWLDSHKAVVASPRREGRPKKEERQGNPAAEIVSSVDCFKAGINSTACIDRACKAFLEREATKN